MSSVLKISLLLSILLISVKSQEIAYYEEVKDAANHPEKLLIDVREPIELEQTGEYPNAINIQSE